MEGLICAATLEELWTFGLDGAEEIERETLYRVREGYAAVTGAGIPFTLLNLIPRLQTLRPAWVVNTGIAGAYPQSGLEIGDVVVGESESFADLGMETQDGGFLPMADFSFADPALRSPLPLWTPAWTASARRAAGATVNACTGSEATGLRRGAAGAGFESMEGAAAALAARAARAPMLEARAISNRAAARDMRPENIRLALKSLAAFWAEHRKHLA